MTWSIRDVFLIASESGWIPSGLQPLEDPACLVTGQQPGAGSQHSPECYEVALERRLVILQMFPYCGLAICSGAWLYVKSCHALVRGQLPNALTQFLWVTLFLRAPLSCHLSLRSVPGSTRGFYLTA